jgi:hypothetical protein
MNGRSTEEPRTEDEAMDGGPQGHGVAVVLAYFFLERAGVSFHLTCSGTRSVICIGASHNP